MSTAPDLALHTHRLLSTCYSMRNEENQPLGPDVFRHGTRDGRGRFAKGHSGNPRGRPPGIPNPKRRLLDFVNRPPKPGAVERLIDRKPYLLRRFAQQVLPYRRVPLDPAARLGIDLSAVRTPRQTARFVTRLLIAVTRGEITPVEALVLVRRVSRRLPNGATGGRRIKPAPSSGRSGRMGAKSCRRDRERRPTGRG